MQPAKRQGAHVYEKLAVLRLQRGRLLDARGELRAQSGAVCHVVAQRCQQAQVQWRLDPRGTTLIITSQTNINQKGRIACICICACTLRRSRDRQSVILGATVHDEPEKVCGTHRDLLCSPARAVKRTRRKAARRAARRSARTPRRRPAARPPPAPDQAPLPDQAEAGPRATPAGSAAGPPARSPRP